MKEGDERAEPPDAGRGSPRNPVFATTHWSVVLAANDSETDVARDALAQLCESYWYPLYAFLRRRGNDPEEARDLTQGFFAHLLGKGDLRLADPARGRFRSFLLTACKNFVINREEAARAGKRGGGVAPLSLDFENAEGRFALDAVEQETPERLFEITWARELLGLAMQALKRDYRARGQGELFDALQEDLAGDETVRTHAEKGEALGMTGGAVKVAAHRMRKRFREKLREEIGRTVADPEQIPGLIPELIPELIEEEIRALFRAFA
jgi:DNA-directed RNA polymerase specialized sigma24 family protein